MNEAIRTLIERRNHFNFTKKELIDDITKWRYCIESATDRLSEATRCLNEVERALAFYEINLNAKGLDTVDKAAVAKFNGN